MSKKYTLSKALLVAFGSLAGVSLLATSICYENVNAINSFLHLTNWVQIETGEGDEIDSEYFKSDYSSIPELIEDTDAKIEEIVEEGAVLIKNENNALPLSKNDKVTLVGIGSYNSVLTSSGSVSGASVTGREVNLKQGLEHAGLNVNQTAWDYYASVSDEYTPTRNGMMVPGPLIAAVNEVPWETANAAYGNTLAQYGDAVIFNVTRVSGEGNKDMNHSGATDTPNGDALTLSNDERNTLRGLKALKDANTIKKIIVLLNGTATVDLDFLNDEQYGVDACLQVQAVGTTGFNGVGDLLVGNVNPSGKSNDTLWVHNSENPTLTNQLGYEFLNPDNLELHTPTDGQGGYEQHYVVYQEGIYLGYRYTETRYEDYVMNTANTGNYDYANTVAVPFGYGESYTEFSYSNLTTTYNRNTDSYTISVTVTNDGDVPGKEAVQVYLQKPYGEYNRTNKIEASAVELVGYNKTTDVIAPNDSETVTITVDRRQFASYDAETNETYVLTPGDYYLAVGNGAHDATNNILAAKGYSPSNTNNRMDAAGNSSLAVVAETISSVDAERYSTSRTGQEINNLFEDSDLNKNELTKNTSPVEYITRSDWNGTVVLDPLDNNTNYTKITMTADLLADFRAGWDGSMLEPDDVEYPTYGDNAGISLATMIADTDGNEIPYDDPLWDEFMDQLTWDDTVALLSEGMRMTAALPSVNKPATVDHNGPLGPTQPYTDGSQPSTFPSTAVLASSFNPTLADEVGELYGENSLHCGYAGLYGPAVNLHRSQYSSRNNEYYSEDSFLSGYTAGRQIKAIQENGVYCYIKHFVLNDQETNRYGLSTWLNEQSFRELYLDAFDITIEIGNPHAMMSSYNRVGTRVSGAKSNLLTDWLRNEAGFDGFVVTDMYQLGSYGSLTFYLGLLSMPTGVFCGNDLVDGSITSAGQFDPYKEGYGELAWKMRESAKRILYTVCHSAGMNGVSTTTRMQYQLTWWQITLISLDAVLGVAALASLGFFSYEFYIRNIKKEDSQAN